MNHIPKPIECLNRLQIIEEWHRLFGAPPPKYLSLKLMHSIFAWEQQAQGGLALDVQRTLSGQWRFLLYSGHIQDQ